MADRTRAATEEGGGYGPRRFGRACLRGLIGLIALTMLLTLPYRWLPPAVTSFMLLDQLEAVWAGAPDTAIDYRWIPYQRISPHLALATLAAEDQRFPDHLGFDLVEIQEAMQSNDPAPRGASTLSQQVAKNLYLWPGRSLLRKGLEAWFTLWLELLWSKQRILEVYLNIAQFGERTFGAEAASQKFFHKPAQALSRQEAALLAAVLPNPRRYQAAAPSSYVRWRQNLILRRMKQLGEDYLNRL